MQEYERKSTLLLGLIINDIYEKVRFNLCFFFFSGGDEEIGEVSEESRGHLLEMVQKYVADTDADSELAVGGCGGSVCVCVYVCVCVCECSEMCCRYRR